MKLMRYGKPHLSYNEGIGLLTKAFMAQHHLFPENFNPTDEYKYESKDGYLHITIPKSSVDTRELKPGQIGYLEEK